VRARERDIRAEIHTRARAIIIKTSLNQPIHLVIVVVGEPPKITPSSLRAAPSPVLFIIEVNQIQPRLAAMSPALVSRSTVDIIDIRSSDAPFSAEQAIHDGLNPPEGGARSFPTVLLYDTKGLQLFEEITYLEEYYLTNAEIELLTAHAKTIAERLPDNAQLVELGSGFVFLGRPRAILSFPTETSFRQIFNKAF
jgi:hypothetical protein